MKKIVINATEGGAHIKGTTRISLKEMIKKYCQDPIDKSKIKSLLSYAPDGDELIKKVIPLLQHDIDNLEEVIVNSRKGMAVSHGIKKMIDRRGYTKLLSSKKSKLFDRLNFEAIKESGGNKILINQLFFRKVIEKLPKSPLRTMVIMSEKNFLFSEAAHIAALKNPLVNVAIYGASRRIQTRDLKGDATINNFLKNKKNAHLRTDRNIIILDAAKTAAESLKKSYKKTLKVLKKYDRTKNNDILISPKPEPIDLSDAEDYFKAGNWAHPLLDALKYIDRSYIMPEKTEISKTAQEISSDAEKLMEKHHEAERILTKATKMKQDAIEKAKKDENEYHDKMIKLVQYNELIEKAKDTGRLNKDFPMALKLMKEAIKLMPDEQEARWGLATALHHSGQCDKSIEEYKKLIKDFPDQNIFQFECGQVLIRNNQLQDGLKEIGKVMKKTDEFDNFLARLGAIYEEGKMIKEAIIAYDSYLEKYPFDFKVWVKKGGCHSALGREYHAKEAYKKALKIKPDLDIKL